jgi:hypothetical protein
MAETNVTNELILEVLRTIRSEIGEVKVGLGDVRQEVRAMRNILTGLTQENDVVLARLANRMPRSNGSSEGSS